MAIYSTFRATKISTRGAKPWNSWVPKKFRESDQTAGSNAIDTDITLQYALIWYYRSLSDSRCLYVCVMCIISGSVIILQSVWRIHLNANVNTSTLYLFTCMLLYYCSIVFCILLSRIMLKIYLRCIYIHRFL